MATVPCIELAGLSETQKRAYIIIDNKSALTASWDNELLTLEFEDLKLDGFDLDLTGFSPNEIENLGPIENYPESSAIEIDPDDYKMGNQCPKCGFEFDAKA